MYQSLHRAALAALLSLLPALASASTLLVIDVTNASAVRFTAHPAAAVDNGTSASTSGFSLTDFFTAPTTGAIGSVFGPISSSLVVSDSGTTTNRVFAPGGGTFLNFFTSVLGTHDLPINTSDATFVSGNQALQGEIVLDLSAYAALLPTMGMHGDVVSGDSSGGFGPRVGNWIVHHTGLSPIPLPAGLPLLLAGLGAFAALRRRTA